MDYSWQRHATRFIKCNIKITFPNGKVLWISEELFDHPLFQAYINLIYGCGGLATILDSKLLLVCKSRQDFIVAFRQAYGSRFAILHSEHRPNNKVYAVVTPHASPLFC